MDQILQDLSDAALVNAIETNRYALAPYWCKWPEAEVYSDPTITWCVTDIPFPPCNAAFKAKLSPEQVDSVIESFKARGQARNVPLHWWIGHDSQPSDLGRRLIAHGFSHTGDVPGMAIDLRSMKEDIPLPSGLRISRVEDLETLKVWVHIVSIGFGVSSAGEPAILKWLSSCLALKLPMQLYLGYFQGVPVTTSMLLLAEGVAGIYFVATLPEARRQGCGFTITQQPLLEARDIGYRVGILQASKLGYPVYTRMGFKEYCKIGVYMFRN